MNRYFALVVGTGRDGGLSFHVFAGREQRSPLIAGEALAEVATQPAPQTGTPASRPVVDPAIIGL
jgi:hypothetical protein